jgi:signal peptidase II
MYFNESIPIIQNIFHITYTRNKGAAFSLLNDLPPAIRAPFFVITGITFLIITAYYFRTAVKKSVIMRIGFSLVAGGALGNLIDRVRYGEVIDFIEVGISERYK